MCHPEKGNYVPAVTPCPADASSRQREGLFTNAFFPRTGSRLVPGGQTPVGRRKPCQPAPGQLSGTAPGAGSEQTVTWLSPCPQKGPPGLTPACSLHPPPHLGDLPPCFSTAACQPWACWLCTDLDVDNQSCLRLMIDHLQKRPVCSLGQGGTRGQVRVAPQRSAVWPPQPQTQRLSDFSGTSVRPVGRKHFGTTSQHGGRLIKSSQSELARQPQPEGQVHSSV